MKMKFKMLIGVVLLTIVTNITAMEQKKAAKLNKATVYFQGAELTFDTSISLSRGENEVVITGLSPNLNINSIKIALDKSAVVNSFEFKRDLLDNIQIMPLQDSIDVCANKIAELNDKITSNENVLSILTVNTSTNQSGNLNFTELLKYAENFKKQANALRAENRQFKEDKKKLESELNMLKHLMSTTANDGKNQQGVLVLKINSAVTATCGVQISYYTPQATWSPYYEINVKDVDSPVVFATKAKVQQNTGIDWNNVTLTLTSTQPSFGKVAPLFSSWYLNFQEIHPVLRGQMAVNKYSERNADLDYMSLTESKEIQFKDEDLSFVDQLSNDVSLSFNIIIPYTLMGDNKAQFVDLKTENIPAEYKYYVVPKLSTDAFLLAEIADWEKLDLMSGDANITFDNTFMGSTYIDAQSAVEKLGLTLGVDPRIVVKREKIQDNNEKKSFLGSTIKQTFKYKITVKNNQNKTISITVKDQYPLSANKDIEVERLTKESTPVTSINTEVGVLNWDLELKPGESRDIYNAYTVKYPKDKKLNL